jgi:voltage-gated potassium channel
MPLPDSHGPVPEPIGPFQLTVQVLSVLALVAIAADAFLPVPHEVSRLLAAVDLIVCGVFFLDFVIRFQAAESKLAFMKFGWIDLLASVPAVDFLRLGRFVRIFRVLRLLRGIRSLHHLLKFVYHNRRRGSIASVVLLTFLMIVFSSIGILLCETHANSNIQTAGDAVWWSVTTITTVGYGDHYPVTPAGRVIAIILMFCGVGLLGSLSGVIALILLGRPQSHPDLTAEIQALREELEGHRRESSARPNPPDDEAAPP